MDAKEKANQIMSRLDQVHEHLGYQLSLAIRDAKLQIALAIEAAGVEESMPAPSGVGTSEVLHGMQHN